MHSANVPSDSPADPQLIADLVIANRILYDQGVLDGFGHVSVRHDKSAERFLLARSMAPALVTKADIMEFDLLGNPIDARGRRMYAERCLHAAIYRARPDVCSVVHSHSPSVIPFGVTGHTLRPIYHMSGFLGSGAPIFDLSAVTGVNDMLISSNALGDALAQALDKHAVALIRGHGSVAVGGSIRQVVYRAIYTEMNARLQMEAAKLGPITFLSPEEARMASEMTDEHLDRPWQLWQLRIGAVE